MSHKTYEESKKAVVKGLFLLGFVTLIEVFISLFGKGHIIPGINDITWIAYPVGFIIAVLSIYKAYFIIYEFMHMARREFVKEKNAKTVEPLKGKQGYVEDTSLFRL